MKISKLFHWLYALLMLLPAFATGVTCAYVIFNKNAYHSYYGETINEEQLKAPTTIDENTNYLLYWSNLQSYSTSNAPRLYVSNFEIENRGSISSTTYDYLVSVEDDIQYLVLTAYNNLPNIQFGGNNVNTVNLTSTDWIFSFNLSSYTGNFNINELRYIEYNKFSFLSSVFYYSVYEVKQNSLFAWAADSFLATPITYVTGLFGMPNDSIVILLLSYWLDISIIYLVFDLIMYVPLLVHRWLDKGVLE